MTGSRSWPPGLSPSTGLSELTIGGANVREGVDVTDEQGNLTTSFTVPGLTGSQLVRVDDRKRRRLHLSS